MENRVGDERMLGWGENSGGSTEHGKGEEVFQKSRAAAQPAERLFAGGAGKGGGLIRRGQVPLETS